MTYTWIKSDQISAGSTIDLLANRITPQFNALTGEGDIPGKNAEATFENKLSEVDYFGISNPSFSVEGEFDKTKTTNSLGSVCLSIPIMGSFYRLGSPCWFYDDDFILNAAGSCEIMFESFKPTRQARTGSTINYSLSLTQTKAW
jgi:hypothetical protein